jgi:hypothetical protein
MQARIREMYGAIQDFSRARQGPSSGLTNDQLQARLHGTSIRAYVSGMELECLCGMILVRLCFELRLEMPGLMMCRALRAVPNKERQIFPAGWDRPRPSQPGNTTTRSRIAGAKSAIACVWTRATSTISPAEVGSRGSVAVPSLRPT